MAVLKINQKDFMRHMEEHDGFCISCGEILEGGFEPDAAEYNCPECGDDSDFGMEEALFQGYVIFT